MQTVLYLFSTFAIYMVIIFLCQQVFFFDMM